MGKSSDTPKEVKIARREETHRVREARGYGAGCVYIHQCYPGYMTEDECYDCGEINSLILDFDNGSAECRHCGYIVFV